MLDKFYDFDQRSETSIEPRYNRDDLLDGDTNPVICDNCKDGITLQPYQQSNLICPRCMHIYDPIFDTIKHDTIETTIEDMQDTHSGTMTYVEDSKQETAHTRIRKKIGTAEEDLPEYLRQEIEFIKNRPGYRTIPLDDKIFKPKKTS